MANCPRKIRSNVIEYILKRHKFSLKAPMQPISDKMICYQKCMLFLNVKNILSIPTNIFIINFEPAKLIMKIIDPVIRTMSGTCDIKSDISSNECSPLTSFSISPL